MIYVTDTTSSVPAYAHESTSETPSADLDRKWLKEVFHHFLEPAYRQLDLDSTIPRMQADDDAELDSPSFAPSELTDLAARGFVRKNRWAVRERKT